MFTGRPQLSQLLQEVRGYTRHTFAESTKASYRTHLRTYIRFCINFHVNPVPIAQNELLAYVAFLARTLKPSSIGNYLNAVRLIHLEAGLDNPLENNFSLNNLKRGIARKLGTSPEQKLPITCKILQDISTFLNPFSSSDIAFWAACVIGFFGFLRKSTLLPKTISNPGNDCLLRSDVVMIDVNNIDVYVRKTKTIQFGQRVLRLPFVAKTGCILCPVSAITKLFIVSSKKSSDPLFSYRKGKKVSWWTHSTFVERLRFLLKKAGYNPCSYSGHSFRRGGASLAFELGLSLTQVKQRGDWASSAVENYIFVSPRVIKEVASVMINGVPKML